MFNNWLKEKVIPCQFCESEKYHFKFSDKKIKRYGVICSGCNRFLAWLPKRYESEVTEENQKENDLFNQ